MTRRQGGGEVTWRSATLRGRLINRVGRFLRPQNRLTLRIAGDDALREEMEGYLGALRKAAQQHHRCGPSGRRQPVCNIGVLSAGAEVILRADAGFWSNKMGAWLMDQEVPFIFSLPLRPGVKLMLRATRWRGLDGDADIQGTVTPGARPGMDPRLRVLGIRRRVLDAKAPSQDKRIDGCERWRYQALVTVMTGQPADLWRFYNGRADCEHIFKVARKALGTGRLVGQQLRANETAFLLRILAFNTHLRFQADAEERAAEAGRTADGRSACARTRSSCSGRRSTLPLRWLLRSQSLRNSRVPGRVGAAEGACPRTFIASR